jgi:regulator of RNase E activity RraA
MGKVGNRVRLTIQRPSPELVGKFHEASPPDLAEAMNMSGAMREIRPIYLPIPKLVGTAITVRAQPGDSLMVAKALAIAQPGDVIVIDGRGVMSRSMWGGQRSQLAAARGIRGAVIDGATRDTDESQAVGVPVFARAICPMGSTAKGPGELNFPIACGGVPVHPGDIVVADAEGIVVIPWQDAENVYNAWRKILEYEKAAQADARAGRHYSGARTERLLAEIECEIIE